ncbi:beta-lactamase hydrolase domain-containing protein [Pseudomonadota bacterium]
MSIIKNKVVWTIVQFTTAAALISVMLSANAAETSMAPMVVKSDIPGIQNYSRFDSSPGFAGSSVGFGGATQPSAMSRLENAGFAAVINLRLATEEGADVDDSRIAAESVGLNYIHLPFDTTNPDPDVVDNFLTAVGDKDNRPVYIHCGSATRVATLWMIGRVLKDGLAIDTASAEVEVIAGKPSDAIAFATNYITSHRK